MLLTSWLQKLFGIRSRRRARRAKPKGDRHRDSFFVQLFVTRLEERRVLNSAPVVDLDLDNSGGTGGVDYATTFTEDAGAVAIVDTADLTISDPDTANPITGAKATITNLQDGTAESLAVNVGMTGISASYNSGNGELTLSNSATRADYEQVLRTLTYNNTDQAPETTDRVVEVTVNDGTDDSAIATSVVTVNPVQDAPTVSNTAKSVDEDQVLSFAAADFTSAFSDVDDESLQSIKITQLETGGALKLSASDVTLNQIIAIGDLGNLTYQSNQDFNGSDSFQWTGSDGTEFAATSATLTITVAPVNDAPVLTATTPSLTGTDEDTTSNEFTVSSILGANLTDADSSSIEGIAITTTTGNGTWQFSIDGGSNYSDVGTVSVSSSLLLRDVDRVRFVPDSENGETAAFGYRGWDRTTGTQGSKVSTSTHGGSTAFSSVADAVSLVVTNVNDAPVLNVVAPSLASTNENTTSNEFTVSSVFGANLSDVDSGSSSGIAVTATTGNGTWQFSINAGTNYNAIGSVSGTSSLLLRGNDRFRYIPDNENGETATITFRGWDQTTGSEGASVNTSSNGGTTALSAVEDTANLVVTAVNDVPVAAAGGPYTIDAGVNLDLDASGSGDVDNGDTLTYKWDFNGDATIDLTTTSAMPTVAWQTLANLGLGIGTHTIDLIVEDSAVAVDATTASLTINDEFQFEPASDGSADSYTLKRAGSSVEVRDTGSTNLLSSVSLTGLDILTITGSSDADTFTVDFSGGNPVPAGGITFAGGDPTSGMGDQLVITGGSATTVTYNFTNASDGSVSVDGSTIGYTGLEPVIDNMAAANRVFTFTGGAEMIELTDATGANNTIDSTLGESVTFANPTASLTINAGTGNDMVNITSVDALFDAALTINGDADADIVTLNTALNLGSAMSSGSLSIDAETINLTNASIRTDKFATNAGNVTLTGDSIVLGANVSIDTDTGNTSDGQINLNGAVTGAQNLTLASGSAGITANNAGNAFGDLTITSASTANVTDATLTFAASNVTGNLTANSRTGDLTDSGMLTVGGNASFTTSQADADINLDTLAVTGTIAIQTSGTTGNATLNNAGGVDLAASTVNGELSVTSNGTITDSGTLDVTGAVSFVTRDNSPANIMLDESASKFGAITARTLNTAGDTVVAGAIAIAENAAMDLADIDTTSTASFTANGAITDSGAVIVGGQTTLAAGAANNITLDDPGNDFNSVAITNGNDVTLVDLNGIELLASTVSGNLNVTADGDDNSTATLQVSGALAVLTGSITLSGGGTGTDDTIDVDVDLSAQSIRLQKADTFDLAGNVDVTATNGSLTVASSGGTIRLSGANGTATIFDGTADNVLLADIVDTNNIDVTVRSDNDITLGSVDVGGTLVLKVDDNNSGIGTLTANALTTAAGKSISITGGTDNNDIVQLSGTVTAGGALDIMAGTLTQDAAIIAGGQVDITVAAALTLDENLTSGAATNISVSADDTGSETFKHTAGTISSTAGTLTIRADDMNLAGTITATGQTVVLRSNSDGDAIEFGGDGTTAGELELTVAELTTITAGTLEIGHKISGTEKAGAIAVNEAVAPRNNADLVDREHSRRHIDDYRRQLVDRRQRRGIAGQRQRREYAGDRHEQREHRVYRQRRVHRGRVDDIGGSDGSRYPY